MSIRYAGQIREYDCGPIALLNLMKWVGVRATLKKHHGILSNLCNVKEGFGSSESDLNRALSQLKKNLFIFTYVKRPKAKGILSHLRDGGSIILVFENENGLHACFIPEIDSKNKDKIVVINGFEGEAKSFVNLKVLRIWIKSTLCRAWLIKKT